MGLPGFSHLGHGQLLPKRLGFVEGSESFEMWRVPPVHPMTRAYLFNITNVDDVWHRSAKPIVQEVGPYTYIETWEREILGWHSDGTFTYRNKKVFKFAPELSSGSEDDVISAVYVPMMVIGFLECVDGRSSAVMQYDDWSPFCRSRDGLSATNYRFAWYRWHRCSDFILQ
ncbi:unnamed protein product [Cyprideis torosa]|uniref:Scavenger receptor class B member 1 n=1 Tax=Cyprideis torosa TaxID=163714 RepID=A0A7R8WHG3_9CRUS|nr:unnamed protein product [Cyprideis torosa]CAG0893781.1 unnamed protein product [Cyprideis torosa]